jgi:hypothetical protein
LPERAATPTLVVMEHETPQGDPQSHVYEPPQVTDYGSLAELTAGGPAGEFTDADFPADTPRGDLTFS